MKCMIMGCKAEACGVLVYGEWAWCSEHYQVWKLGVDIRKSSKKVMAYKPEP